MSVIMTSFAIGSIATFIRHTYPNCFLYLTVSCSELFVTHVCPHHDCRLKTNDCAHRSERQCLLAQAGHIDVK